MDKSIGFGGVALVSQLSLKGLETFLVRHTLYWSVKIEFEFWRRVKYLTDLVLKENRITLDQLNTAQVGPKARRYLRKIDRWLARQDPRLISG